MYRKRPRQQLTFDFALPFGGKLRKDNRWVILADLIPWDEIEDQYATLFEGSDTGGEGKPDMKEHCFRGLLTPCPG